MSECESHKFVLKPGVVPVFLRTRKIHDTAAGLASSIVVPLSCRARAPVLLQLHVAVSYTHLTLPTICSV
eukprot:8305723-Alexandrium_andersonii.AAC.1